MKYAIINISGKQLWLEPGKYYDLNLLPSTKLGQKIILNRVLFFKDNDQVLMGNPYLENIKIKAKIIKYFSAPKLIVYKMLSKKKKRKKQGHRQKLTRILIEDIKVI